MSQKLVDALLKAKNNTDRHQAFDDLCQWFWWRHFDEYMREHGHEPSFHYSDNYDLEGEVWKYILKMIKS